jgi:hypothetical protein
MSPVFWNSLAASPARAFISMSCRLTCLEVVVEAVGGPGGDLQVAGDLVRPVAFLGDGH